MSDVREATASLLEAKPSMESALWEVLEVDEDGPWTFDDLDLDSGTFGEIVSTGIVEKVDSGYRVADREAIVAALEGEELESAGTGAREVGRGLLERIQSRVDRGSAVLLAGALTLLVLFRLVSFPAVFRGDDIVLLANDPYYYRYWVEQAIANGGLSTLPAEVKAGEPLLIATLWLASSILGGSQKAVGMVLAWYPVVAAIVVGVLVYLTAKEVSGDRRVGLASVLMLVLIPVHAYRSGLGFADHHAFDYIWLALTALALVHLVSESSTKRMYAGVLGVGVTGQVLAWESGPLLILPIGLFVVCYSAMLLERGKSPVKRGIPLVAGLVSGSILVGAAHAVLGWHTPVVASAPLLLAVGSAAVFGLAELFVRQEYSTRALLGAEVVGGVGVLGGVLLFLPDLARGFSRGVDFLFNTEGIAETTSIVSGQMGTIIGPIFVFGLVFFIALPYIGWALVRGARGEGPAWVALSVYALAFLLLSLVQLRFAGELSVFIAVFAGVGFVDLCSRMGLIGEFNPFRGDDAQRGVESSSTVELEMPSRREAMSFVGVSAFVGSLSFIQIPVKFSQLTIDEADYEAALFMREYAEEREWEYPENYVFSAWGRNRVYNYFVNGRSNSYGFAEQNFGEFLQSSDPQQWYERLKERVGFVLVAEGDDGQLATQLMRDGRGNDSETALSHYRTVYAGESLCVMTLVEGATVVGTSDSDLVAISTQIETPAETGEYSASVATDRYGFYQVTVPYAGEYSIDDQSVSIAERAVLAGETVQIHNRYAHWPFDAGTGDVAKEVVQAKEGHISELTWEDSTSRGTVLRYDSSSKSFVEAAIEAPEQFTLSLWINPSQVDTTNENDWRELLSGKIGKCLILEENQKISFRVPGVDYSLLVGGTVETGRWTHVAATYDGSERQIFVDGELVASETIGEGTVHFGGAIRIGDSFTGGAEHTFDGLIDDVRIYDKALRKSEIREMVD